MNLNKLVQRELEEYIYKHPGKFTKMIYFKMDKLRNTYCEHLIQEYLNEKFDEILMNNSSDFGYYEKIFWKTNKIKFINYCEYDPDSDDEDNTMEYDYLGLCKREIKSRVTSNDISRRESISDFSNFNCLNNTDRSFRGTDYYLRKAQRELFTSTRSKCKNKNKLSY